MRTLRNRLMIAIITLCMLFSSFSFAVGAYELDRSEASVGGYYLYNVENDLVMAQGNSADLISPSSTVKIMTACIALETDIPRDKVITVTSEMLDGVVGRNMRLDVGDRVTYDDLLYATVCGGYNDAAHALALTVSGSMTEFVDLMNEKARELGMTSTNYVNVTGIQATGMSTTVEDIAKLATYMSKNDEFLGIGATKSYRISSSATCDFTTVTNRSGLLASYKGMSNINTGSGDFGDCAVLCYKRNGLTFITVVMNSSAYDKDDQTNFAELYSKRLIAHAMNDYSQRKILETKNVVASLPVKYSISGDEVNLYPANAVSLFLPTELDIKEELSYSTYIYTNELQAPLNAGDVVGELIISHDGRILATVPLVIKESVEKNGFLYAIEIMKDYILSRAFVLTLLSFGLIFVVYYLTKIRRLQKMYRQQTRRGKR